MLDDEERPTAAERRVRAVLRSADDRAAAIARRALAEPERSSIRQHAAWVALTAVALLIAAAFTWRESRPPQPALHIWGSGSVVVVTRDDGRRWLVDSTAREGPPRGQYVIVVPQ